MIGAPAPRWRSGHPAVRTAPPRSPRERVSGVSEIMVIPPGSGRVDAGVISRLSTFDSGTCAPAWARLMLLRWRWTVRAARPDGRKIMARRPSIPYQIRCPLQTHGSSGGASSTITGPLTGFIDPFNRHGRTKESGCLLDYHRPADQGPALTHAPTRGPPSGCLPLGKPPGYLPLGKPPGYLTMVKPPGQGLSGTAPS